MAIDSKADVTGAGVIEPVTKIAVEPDAAVDAEADFYCRSDSLKARLQFKPKLIFFRFSKILIL